MHCFKSCGQHCGKLTILSLFPLCLDNSVLILGLFSIFFHVPNFTSDSKLCIYHDVFKFIFDSLLTFNSAATERKSLKNTQHIARVYCPRAAREFFKTCGHDLFCSNASGQT